MQQRVVNQLQISLLDVTRTAKQTMIKAVSSINKESLVVSLQHLTQY